MAWELSITSAPRGLHPGRAGFCPVAHTQGMPPQLIERLEKISGYRHLEIGAGNESRNPVVYGHTVLRLGRETFHVLSRICDAGRDYSGRSNRFAYHLVLKPQELVPAGPAELLQRPELMLDKWDGQLRVIPTEKEIPKITSEPRPCELWQKVLGDAGWAGVLAQRFLQAPQETIYFVYPLQIDMLKLFQEVIALLPESLRWKVTFSTYYQGLGEVVTCRWRAIPEIASEYAAIMKQQGPQAWDLRSKRGPAPATSEADAAREGRLIELPTPTKVSVPVPEMPVPQPVTVPAPSPQESAHLELANKVDAPPPLWVASKRVTPKQRKRRIPIAMIKSLATLAAGVVIGLALGFVLWSGTVMRPLLQAFLVNTAEREPDQARDMIGEKPGAKQAVRGDQQKPPERKPLPVLVQRNEIKKGEQPVPVGSKNPPQQGKPPEPPADQPSKPEPMISEPLSEKPPEGKATNEANRPDDGERSVVSANGPPDQGNAVSEDEFVAAPISELRLKEIVKIFLKKTPTGAPGVKTLQSWESQRLWSRECESTQDFFLLKVVDDNGQAQYYVLSMNSIPVETLALGQEKTIEIPPLVGMTPEVRCVGGWKKGQTTSEFVFSVDGKDRARLKIERKPAKITVKVDEVKQGDGPPLPKDLMAQIGFYASDGPKRVWCPIVDLQIRSGAKVESARENAQPPGGNR